MTLRRSNFAFSTFIIVSLLAATYGSADTIVFTDDFDGNQSTTGGVSAAFSGVTTTESVQGYAGIGNGTNQFGGDFLRNITGGLPTTGTPGQLTTLTLSNLPAHTSISLGFLLATIDSWDGIDGNVGVTGDYFNVHVDGVEVFEATFAQLSGTTTYQAPAGGELSTGTNLFGLAFVEDGAYDMNFENALSNITHTSSTLVIDFFADGPGWQGEQPFNIGLDESWAVDNVQVTVHGIPEPTSTGLIAVGVACLVSRSRRRKFPK